MIYSTRIEKTNIQQIISKFVRNYQLVLVRMNQFIEERIFNRLIKEMIQGLKIILILSFAMMCENVSGQCKDYRSHEIGINLLQIPATTIDLSYETSGRPSFSWLINTGYTINYENSYDLIGFFLTPHYKCGNDGYSIQEQSGGFLKTGIKFNFRNTYEKSNYFYLGLFMTNSMSYEQARFQDMEDPDNQIETLNHNVFIIGFTAVKGYHFLISDILTSDFGIHFSVPSKNYEDLYGYCNYIPGMGYMETCGNELVFPMLVLNFKYKLQ